MSCLLVQCNTLHWFSVYRYFFKTVLGLATAVTLRCTAMLGFLRSVYITVYLYSRETIKLVREGFKKIIFVYITQMGEGGGVTPTHENN